MSIITPQNPLLLLGCGKMGFAMLNGWLANGVSPEAIHVIDPHSQEIQKKLKNKPITCYAHKSEALGLKPSILLLAVKPQSLDELKAELKSLVTPQTLIISIAVGKNLAYLADIFGSSQPLIRAMPNTPSQIGQGVTALCHNAHISPEQQQLTQQLMEAIGTSLWIDETQMDVVSALSGSGPAWLFLLTEAMAKAATDLGLPQDMAQDLARKTIEGSAALMQASPHLSPIALRKAVTSPKGTTHEAMEVLTGENGWQDIITKAMGASVRRAMEISKE